MKTSVFRKVNKNGGLYLLWGPIDIQLRMSYGKSIQLNEYTADFSLNNNINSIARKTGKFVIFEDIERDLWEFIEGFLIKKAFEISKICDDYEEYWT